MPPPLSPLSFPNQSDASYRTFEAAYKAMRAHTRGSGCYITNFLKNDAALDARFPDHTLAVRTGTYQGHAVYFVVFDPYVNKTQLTLVDGELRHPLLDAYCALRGFSYALNIAWTINRDVALEFIIPRTRYQRLMADTR
jgi:hypothetical protein